MGAHHEKRKIRRKLNHRTKDPPEGPLHHISWGEFFVSNLANTVKFQITKHFEIFKEIINAYKYKFTNLSIFTKNRFKSVA